MNMNSSFFLQALDDVDAVLLTVALFLGLLFALLVRRRAQTAQTAEAVSSDEPAAPLSGYAAQEKVFDLVNKIRKTGVQLEISTVLERGLILEIRRSSKLELKQNGLLDLLGSVAGVSSVILGGGKSKGFARRYPITVSVYFNNDASGHHASVDLVEAIG